MTQENTNQELNISTLEKQIIDIDQGLIKLKAQAFDQKMKMEVAAQKFNTLIEEIQKITESQINLKKQLEITQQSEVDKND